MQLTQLQRTANQSEAGQSSWVELCRYKRAFSPHLPQQSDTAENIFLRFLNFVCMLCAMSSLVGTDRTCYNNIFSFLFLFSVFFCRELHVNLLAWKEEGSMFPKSYFVTVCLPERWSAAKTPRTKIYTFTLEYFIIKLCTTVQYIFVTVEHLLHEAQHNVV